MEPQGVFWNRVTFACRNLFLSNRFLQLFFFLTLLFQLPIVLADAVPFRIGTGGSAGNYFPIGTIVSRAITEADLDYFDQSGEDAQLVAVAQRSNGSVANVNDVEAGLLEAALSQSDIAHWAYHATGPFEGSIPKKSLRTVASLYSENVHLVARIDSGIDSMRDLIGRTVSIDEIGSGTLFDVRLVLSAFDIELADINPVYLKPKDSIKRFRDNELDAFILVAGYPVQQIVDLVNDGKAMVVPIQGAGVQKLIEEYKFLSEDILPAGTYKNKADIKTLAVSAKLIVHVNLDEELVYQMTKTLWSTDTANALRAEHPIGEAIVLGNAVKGVSIPLHPGAERYYQERDVDLSRVPLSE